MRVTRRELIAGAAAGALGGAGIYELVDRLADDAPKRAVGRMGASQHELSLRVVQENGVEVVVPPLHHAVVTGVLSNGNLRRAQRELEDALAALEERYDPTTPAGLGVTVAWGLPYFRRHVSDAWSRHEPRDVRARKPALLDAIEFPSDLHGVLLEANDVAVLLRSDSRAHVDAGIHALFDDLRVFDRTSIRRGFVGGNLPKRMAEAAGVPGADLIPEGAELFLGFTSTQKAGLGPTRIANLETLGYTDAAGGYFHGGTHMHLSHIFEDVEAWYLNFDFGERVATAFRPGLEVRAGTQTVKQDLPADDAEVVRDFRRSRRIGHSTSIQTTSRLHRDFVAHDGTVYAKGTAIPQRADFNTLDNPFAWSADAQRDGMSSQPAAGVHFVVFNPTSDDFHRNRLAMDGVLPDGTRLPLPQRSRGQGLNSVLRATHRQNFLVPPRRHRSFPLAEL